MKFSELKNGDIGMVTKVWRQDFTKFVHTAVELRYIFEISVLMTPALYRRNLRTCQHVCELKFHQYNNNIQ